MLHGLLVLVSDPVADPGGPGPPLAPIFAAPDYILRPKLHILWWFFGQTRAGPPWPNPGSVTADHKTTLILVLQ